MTVNGAQLYGRSMAFPPRVGADGRIAWSQGETNIRESIQVILQTEAGERLQLAGFGGGLRRFLFEPNTVATRNNIAKRISESLAAWEPRISVTAVDVEEDPGDPESAVATIEYKLVATQVKERFTLSVKLAE